MFEFWIGLANVILWFIGVYCGISAGIWLMVQAIDEFNRIRYRKPIIQDCGVDYKSLYEELTRVYQDLNTKYNIVCRGEEQLMKHFEELQETAKDLESEILDLKVENRTLRKLSKFNED